MPRGTSVPRLSARSFIVMSAGENNSQQWFFKPGLLPQRIVLSVLFLSSAAIGQRADHEPMLLRPSNVSKAAIEPLVPLCARAAGIEVQAEYANNPAVAKDIIDGERFDVVVVETHILDDLATRDLVARSSIRPLAALRMGLATREPPPYPRIDTEPRSNAR